MAVRQGALFHGTRAAFRRGGLLLPRSGHGGEMTTAPVMPGRVVPPDAGDWVYLTTDLMLAWVYAWHAPGTRAPRVLTVMPLGPLAPDGEHSEHMCAYRCAAAAVRAVDHTPTCTEHEARTGWLIEA